MTALNGDKVAIKKIFDSRSGRRSEAVIVNIIERANDFVVGIFEKSKNYGFVVPDNLKIARDIFIEVLDSVTEESRRLDGSAITDHIATMACKAAVKGNNKLSFKEADTLIEQLLQAKNPYTCPHGRPTIISLSKYELEKKFKRIQS